LPLRRPLGGGDAENSACRLAGTRLRTERQERQPEEIGEETMSEKQDRKEPEPTDVHVGGRIRLRRNLLGMSQEKLGEQLGITFQQIQKYEKGTNRVGASRLQAIATILGVPVAYFFEEGPDAAKGAASGTRQDLWTASAIEFCMSPEGMQLNRAFMRIRDIKVRRRIIDLVKSLGADGSD
jgi:transcriptional regulator with XRE-family HTH domain